MALNEIYLEIFGFYGSPSQKGSWPGIDGHPNALNINIVMFAYCSIIVFILFDINWFSDVDSDWHP